MDEFKDYLQQHSITINERNSKQERGGKSWTYYHPNGGKVRGSKLGNEYTRDEVVDSLSKEREMERGTALEQVQDVASSGSVLDKALALANEVAKQEQEKEAALEMGRESERPDIADWNQLSEIAKDEITHDLNTIDDYGLGR